MRDGALALELLTATATVRGRAYDVVTHQQAAIPEQLLASTAVGPKH
ncbi:hypothetical protein [Streptomyces werraensis]